MSSVRSYPPTQPHRIITSTEPAPRVGGFMRSVMRHHVMDDLDEGIVLMSQPEKKITQDALDEKERAMRNLVNSWQERLQLISVITTFFVSTEAAVLVNTKPASSDDWGSGAIKASNASLLGALIVHVYAAILSFLGAFLLIRYKIKEATREEMVAEGIKLANSPRAGSVSRDVERDPTIDLGLRQTLANNDGQSTLRNVNQNTTTTTMAGIMKKGSYQIEPPIMSKNPHLEQVGPFTSNSVSCHLLSRTHSLCVFLASVGFVLAIVGAMCYAWASQPTEVSVFASACFGSVLVAIVISLFRVG